MKSIFLNKETLWFLGITLVLVPVVTNPLLSIQEQNWSPKNPQLQSIYQGCKNLENLSSILGTLSGGLTLPSAELKAIGTSLFKAILNTSSLGAQIIKALEEDLPELKQYYDCVIQSDSQLRSYAQEDENICTNLKCFSKQSCVGATLGETATFLTPFVYRLLGKLSDEQKKTSGSSATQTFDEGLIANLETLAMEVLKIANQTGLTNILGSQGKSVLEDMEKKLKALKTITTSLAAASNDILFALKTAAPLLGGTEYIEALPELSEKERSELLQQQIEFDPEELDNLTLEDFLF